MPIESRNSMIMEDIDESLEGKNLEEIAESMGTTPAEAALRIYEVGEASVISYGMTEEDVGVSIKTWRHLIKT